MSKFKEINRETINYVDSNTGELLDQTTLTKSILVKDKDQFFTAFSKLVMAFSGLDYAEAKTLVWCAANTELNTNRITMVKYQKELLAQQMGMEFRTVGNTLGRLVEKGFMHRVAQAVYMIDPDLTWKGLLNERSKQVNVFLEYTLQNP